MKKAAWLLLVVWLVTGCNIKRRDDPAPAAPDIAGTYQMSLLASGGQTFTLPRTSGGITESGSIVVVKNSDTQIGATINTFENGRSTSSQSLNLPIQLNGTRYDITRNGANIGYVDGTNFNLDFIANDGTRAAIIGRK